MIVLRHAGEEPFDADDAVVGEVASLFPRGSEQQGAAQHVCAVGVDVVVGGDDVAAALGHLGAVVDDHAAKADAGEWFIERDQSQIVQRHGDEPGVQVMALHVLGPTGVEVDGQDPCGALGIPWSIVELGGGVAQEVPGGIDEGVADVGLAAPGRAAGGARDA